MKDRDIKRFFDAHRTRPADDGFTQRVMNERHFYPRAFIHKRNSTDWIVWLSGLLALIVFVLLGGLRLVIDYALPVLTDWDTTLTDMNYVALFALFMFSAGSVLLVLVTDN